jgi:hypothetical protein
MSNIRYNHPTDNVITAATITLAAGAALSGYGLTNLTDLNQGFPFKWDAATGRINFDFGSAQTISLVALLHHNLDAALAVKWEAGATLGASTFSQAFTIGAKDADNYRPNSYLDLATGLTPPNYRYHSLKVEGTNSHNVIIGAMWMGSTVRTLTYNIGYKYHREDPRPGASSWKTRAGVEWTNPSYGRQRLISGDVQTTDAGIADLAAWNHACGGTDQPTLIVPGIEDITDALLAKWTMNHAFDPDMIDNVTKPVGWLELAKGLPWP